MQKCAGKTSEMNCIKCNRPAVARLRDKNAYCNDCIINSINHKFRACIGKNKLLSTDENVLLCLSGGPSSTVLLDLVSYGISLHSHKKLRVVPTVLHVIEKPFIEADICKAKLIIKQCSELKLDVYIINIMDYNKKCDLLKHLNKVPSDSNCKIKYDELFSCMSPTTYHEIISKIKRKIFIKCADILQCKYIFTGETTTTLASNLLCNIVTGGGSHIEHDIGFSDKRDSAIHVLRPMKDITSEELHYYIGTKNLLPAHNETFKENSLQSVIGDFITDLQKNYPATISTVCKIADKISTQNRSKEKCSFCKGNLDIGGCNLTADDATKLSRLISSNIGQEVKDDIENCVISFSSKSRKTLCYNCGKNLSEAKTIDVNETVT